MAGETRTGAAARASTPLPVIDPTPVPPPDMRALNAASKTLLEALVSGLGAMANLQNSLGVLNTKLDNIRRYQVHEGGLLEGLLEGIISAETIRNNEIVDKLGQLGDAVAAVPGAQAQIDATVAKVADNIAKIQAAMNP